VPNQSIFAYIFSKVGAVGSLCLSLTARGLDSSANNNNSNTNTSGLVNPNTSWPFVTMDAFQERAASARILSNVLHMSLLPVVTDDQKQAWEDYSVANSQWYSDGFAYQEATTTSRDENTRHLIDEKDNDKNATEVVVDEFDLYKSYIYEYTPAFTTVPAVGSGPYTPVWQSSPLTYLDGVNLNLRSLGKQGELISLCMENKQVVFGGFFTSEPGNTNHPNFLTAWYSGLLSTAAGRPVDYNGDPIIEASYPIFRDFSDERELVAVMMFQFSWQTYFRDILPANSEGFMLVLSHVCDGGSYTYIIDGGDVKSIGAGDLHDSAFDGMESVTLLEDGMVIQDGSREGVKLNLAGCPYVLRVYPTAQLRDKYITRMPLLLTAAIAVLFLFTIAMFILYDRLVERRQRLVVQTAKQSSDIVSSLFPENVRVRLLENGYGTLAPNQRLKSYLVDGDTRTVESTKPIADLFAATTVMFADISGFTAWYVHWENTLRKALLFVYTYHWTAGYVLRNTSFLDNKLIHAQASTREPSQVFILLETIYQVMSSPFCVLYR
jgi:hypothetical protein